MGILMRSMLSVSEHNVKMDQKNSALVDLTRQPLFWLIAHCDF